MNRTAFGIYHRRDDMWLTFCETPGPPHGWALIRSDDGPITAFGSRERAIAQMEEFGLSATEFEVTPLLQRSP